MKELKSNTCITQMQWLYAIQNEYWMQVVVHVVGVQQGSKGEIYLELVGGCHFLRCHWKYK